MLLVFQMIMIDGHGSCKKLKLFHSLYSSSKDAPVSLILKVFKIKSFASREIPFREHIPLTSTFRFWQRFDMVYKVAKATFA